MSPFTCSRSSPVSSHDLIPLPFALFISSLYMFFYLRINSWFTEAVSKLQFWNRLKSQIFWAGLRLEPCSLRVGFAMVRTSRTGWRLTAGLPSARWHHARAAPARCSGPVSGNPACVLHYKPPIQALSTEILRHNRPDKPPYSTVAGKNSLFYGCGAILRSHLVRSHVWLKF
jgi:hypothetical protein